MIVNRASLVAADCRAVNRRSSDARGDVSTWTPVAYVCHFRKVRAPVDAAHRRTARRRSSGNRSHLARVSRRRVSPDACQIGAPRRRVATVTDRDGRRRQRRAERNGGRGTRRAATVASTKARAVGRKRRSKGDD